MRAQIFFHRSVVRSYRFNVKKGSWRGESVEVLNCVCWTDGAGCPQKYDEGLEAEGFEVDELSKNQWRWGVSMMPTEDDLFRRTEGEVVSEVTLKLRSSG